MVVEVNGYKIEPDADLTGANLTGVDPTYVNFTGATMPDGTIHN